MSKDWMGRLTPLGKKIKESLDEAFGGLELEQNLRLDDSFLRLLSPKGKDSIASALSDEEKARYYMAYQQVINRSNLQERAAFEAAMKQHILATRVAKLKRTIEDLPTEAQALARAMMSDLYPTPAETMSIERQINHLSKLQSFLTKDLNEPIDLNDERYQSLFSKFKPQLAAYNRNFAAISARAAIKTEFYSFDSIEEFKRSGKRKTNCLVACRGSLYHVNSAGDQVRLPDVELLGLAITNREPTKEEKANIPVNACYVIYQESTNSYLLGFNENGRYVEKPLNSFLGDHTPYDPNLLVATAQLNRAIHGPGSLEVMKRAMDILPASGKYFSFVHRGKVRKGATYTFSVGTFDPPIMQKDTIYLYPDVRGGVFYSVIGLNGEPVRRQRLSPALSQALLENSVLQNAFIDSNQRMKIMQGAPFLSNELSAIRDEAAHRGHVYIRGIALPLLSSSVPDIAPDTMASKLRTKAGYADSMKQLRKKKEALRAAYEANTWFGGRDEAKIKEMEIARDMASGVPMNEGHLKRRPCGMEIATEEGDLTKNKMFMNHVKDKNSSTDTYYLQVVNNQAIGLYFVDRSGPHPIVQKREPSTFWLDRPASLMGIAVDAEPPELFYQHLHRMLQAVENPLMPEDDEWIKLGMQHVRGPIARFVGNQDPDNDENSITEVKRKVQLGEVIFFRGSNEQIHLYCLNQEGNIQQVPIDWPNSDKTITKLLVTLSKREPLNQQLINNLNSLLKGVESLTSIPLRKPSIDAISPELADAISAKTRKIGSKGTVSDDLLEQYAYNEVSNDLSFVIEARRELQRQHDSEIDAMKMALEGLGHKILEEKSKVTQPRAALLANRKQIYYDKDTKKWIIYSAQDQSTDHRKQRGNSVCKVETISFEKIAEKFPQDELPVIHTIQQLNAPLRARAADRKSRIDLTDELVDEAFLSRCEAVQRCLAVGDSAHQTRAVASMMEMLSAEQREKILAMQVRVVSDPNDLDAQHYLRESHKLYITEGPPVRRKDTDEWSFYLDIKSVPDTPHLYRFIQQEDEWKPIRVQLDTRRFSSSPENTLKAIAEKQLKAQGKALTADESVNLSCRDVYYQITMPSKESLKTGTAGELFEEIEQARYGSGKRWENLGCALFGLFTIGTMASPFLIFNAPIVILSFNFMMQMIFGAAVGLASLLCLKGALFDSSWFKPGVSRLKEELATLNTAAIRADKLYAVPQPVNHLAAGADAADVAVVERAGDPDARPGDGGHTPR